MDSISIEVFTDNGRTTMTNNIFSNPESNDLSINTVGGRTRLLCLQTFGLKSTVIAWSIAEDSASAYLLVF